MDDRKAKIKNLLTIFQRIEKTEEELEVSEILEEKK
jgi:hypothetical protein